jgi:hypothetical protein
MSFAFTVSKDKWTEATVDGKTTYHRDIEEIDTLYDVTVTATPAYPQTDAGTRSESVEEIVRRVVAEIVKPNTPDVESAPKELEARDGSPGRRRTGRRVPLHRWRRGPRVGRGRRPRSFARGPPARPRARPAPRRALRGLAAHPPPA